MKDTGNNTQGRVDSFSLQCAKRCCKTMMFNIAKSSSDARIAKKYERVAKRLKPEGRTYKGKFTLKVESITDKGYHVGASAVWADKYSKEKDPDPKY